MEHINTFNKGVHSDSTLIYQPDGTLRFNKNFVLTSYDGNNFALEDRLANRILVKVNQRYGNTYASVDKSPMPIGWFSSIEDVTVFNTNDETDTGEYGEIGIITFGHFENKTTATYVPIYHHRGLKFTKKKMIGKEGFVMPENSSMKGVYWTDNHNQPRVINTRNPIFTTYFATGSLVVGKTYMVLQGAITHNGIDYYPSSNVAITNIFTAANANYTTITGSVLVIEYYPIELLDWVPDRVLGNIQFVSYGVGSVNCGNNIYYYRLSNKNDGITTAWSYGAFPIHVGMNNDSVYLGATGYEYFVGNGGAGTNSAKSVRVKIDQISPAYDMIELCCVAYESSLTTPTSIRIVKRQTLAAGATSVVIEHTGTENYGDVPIDQLTTFPASILRVGTMTTNKMYNLIADLTERKEFQIDLSAATAAAVNYPMVSWGDLDNAGNPNLCANMMAHNDVSPAIGVNPAANTIRPHSRWLVTNGDLGLNQVVYNAVNYVTGEVITGIAGQVTITFTGTGTARPCTTKNRYTSLLSGKRVENAIELTQGYWDYKDPAVAQHNLGNWSTETYRYGWLAFDLKGNPFFIRWVLDFAMPDIASKGGLFKADAYRGGTIYSLNPSGVSLSNLIIPPDIMDQISGFSIVRAPRDRQIITQGLMMQVVNTALSPDIYYPIPTIFGQDAMHGPSLGVLTMICPDELVGADLQETLKEGDKLKEAAWLEALGFAGAYQGSHNSDRDVVAKYMTSSSKGTKRETLVGNVIKYYNENDYETDWDGPGSGKDFDNTLHCTNIQCGIDNTCSGGAANIQNCEASGGKKIFLKINGEFNNSANTGNYTTGSNSDQCKILMNWIKPKSTLYGGTGPDALANTLYISTGHYQPITAQVKADTWNGTNYVFNNIEVFGGDCYTCHIDYGYGLWNDNSYANPYSYAMMFPCECNANYNMRRGRKVVNDEMRYSGSAVGYGIAFNSSGAIRLEDYSYNKAYSVDGSLFVKYPALPNNYKNIGEYESLMRYAGEKIPGEQNNSFRTFALNDKKQIDAQGGRIANVRTKDGRVIVIQDRIVSTVPILERTLVGGSALGDQTVLGTGGVVDRYDPLNSFFGNKHRHGLVETEDGFIWFDMRRRAMIKMLGTQVIRELSLEKGWQNFFNTAFVQNNLLGSEALIYNTDTPLMGIGISGVYDPEYKCTYLTFKFLYTDHENDPPRSILNRDFTVVYSHKDDLIIGFLDAKPAIWHNHDNLVLSANNPKCEDQYYGANMISTLFNIGNTVFKNNIEYICYNPITITSYPGAANQQPDYPGSIYWKQLNETREIYIDNEIPVLGTKNFNQFYGKVWSNKIQIVVNPKLKNLFNVDWMRRAGNGINFTDITIQTQTQTAQDLNIKGWNRNYNYKRNEWNHNLPLPKNGRAEDRYLLVTFEKKNYDTDPTIPLNKQMILQYIASIIRERI